MCVPMCLCIHMCWMALEGVLHGMGQATSFEYLKEEQ